MFGRWFLLFYPGCTVGMVFADMRFLASTHTLRYTISFFHTMPFILLNLWGRFRKLDQSLWRDLKARIEFYHKDGRIVK